MTATAQISSRRVGQLLFKDNFRKGLKHWIVEAADTARTVVEADEGKLRIDAPKGVTVWLNKKLSGNYIITYKRKVVMAGGKNDRLSDLNQFWMATDPSSEDLFKRNGIFEEYDSLSLYYVGMGGNTNSTTRFRKYHGNGSKPLLAEFKDQEHLLQANKVYTITTVVNDGVTEFFVDGEKYFSFHDLQPLKEGYFGIRTTKSHQEVYNFEVRRIKD